MSTAHIIGKRHSATPNISAGETAQASMNAAAELLVSSGTAAGSLGKAEDAAHASGDTGVAILAKRTDTAASSSATDGDYVTVNSDSLGHLWNREGYAPQYEDNTNGVGAMVIKPLAVSTYSPTLFTNFGANTTLNIKATPGNVFSFYVTNTNAAVRYFQLHNTATTPAGGAVPLRTYTLPALTGVLIIGTDVLTQAGVNFSTGIAFATSTTAGTYTAATAGDHYVEVNFK